MDRYNELPKILDSLHDDFEKSHIKKIKVSGVRIRRGLREVKKAVNIIIKEIQEIKRRL